VTRLVKWFRGGGVLVWFLARAIGTGVGKGSRISSVFGPASAVDGPAEALSSTPL
jgi:hypothetical protein